MEFADFDSGFLKRGNCFMRLFKFDGEMAAVVIDAEKFVEARIVLMFAAQLLEKLNRSRRNFPAGRAVRVLVLGAIGVLIFC